MENQIREFTKKGNRRRLFKRVVSLLCVVVLLFTMNTLKRNANTLERIAMCGLQEHTHTAGCYNSSGELVCAIPEHVHTDACYQQSPSDDLVLNGDDLEIADGLVDAGDTQSLDLSLDLDQGELLDFVQDSDAPASNVQDIGNDMPVLDGDLVFDTSYNNGETQQLAANTSVEEAQGAVDETQSEEAQQLLEEEQIAVEDGQDQSTGEGQEQITFEEDQEQPVEQPTEAAQEQPVEEETEQPVEEEQEQPVEEAQEQPVEEETEQPVEEAQEQPVEEETEQPVEGEQLVEEDQDQIAIEEQPVVAEQEQPVEEKVEQPAEEVQEQLVIEGQEEPVVEAQEEPVVEEQEEPVVEEQEEPVVEEQEEPVVEEQEEPAIEEQEEPAIKEQEEPVVEEQEEPAIEEQEEPVVEEQEEPVVEAQEEPAIEEQEEPVVEEQEEPAIEEQEEPVVEEQEEPVVEEQEEPAVEEQEEPVVEEQEEPVVEEQEEPVVEEQEEPAIEEQEEPVVEEQEEPAIEEAGQPAEEEAEQPAEEEAEQPTEEEAEQPAEEEAEQPTEEEAEQPAEEEAEQPTEEEAEQPAEENAEQAAEEEAEQPAEEEAEQPAEEEAEQPAEEEAEQPAEENAEQAAEEEAEQPAEEEAEQPAEEEAEQPAEEETEEPAIEEAEQPAEVESDPEAEGESEEEPEAKIAYPAKQFRQGTAYINVSVDAPEGAFPEGTVMVVKDVEDQGTIDNIQQSVAEDFVEVTSVHAVDISFWYNDAEIEPLLPIAVVMSAVEAPNEDHETVVVHVDDNGETQLVDSEATGAAEAALEMPAAADAEAQVFEADTFSVYALVTKQVIETKYIDDHGDTWRIKVDYGRDAKLPEGASLQVSEVTSESYLAEAEAALESGKRITKARFFDIKIMDGDREVQPDDQVKVTINLVGDEGEVEAEDDQADIGNADVVAMHFVEQDDEIVSVETKSAVETDEGVVFHADGFSAWGVVYTVDFEVEGDQGEITLDFTAFDALKLPGEGDICYNTEDCSIHVALARLSSIVGSEAEAGYDIDVNANLVNNYEFDFDKAEMGKSDSGMRFADGELVIASDGFVELTEGERLLRVRATGLTALKEALLETEGASIEVVEGNVPLGSEASYTAHTDEETAELVENYINNEENGDSEVAGYSAADLKIVRNEETLPVEGQFKVTVDKASLVPVGMKLDKLYHIHRDEKDEAVVEELAFEETEAGLVFEVGNFSDIVASYTVDFEYNGYQFSMPGGEAIRLSKLFEVLHIEDPVLGNETLSFTDEALIAIESVESDWLLHSLQPFNTREVLTVTMANGNVYVIDVTDSQVSTSLPDAIAVVTLNGTEIGANTQLTVRPEDTFRLHLEFKEVSGSVQFPTDGATYKLNGFVPGAALSGVSMPLTYTEDGLTHTLAGCTYDVSADGTITFHFTEEAKEKINYAGDGLIRLDIDGSFQQGTNHVDFGGGKSVDLTFDTTNAVDIQKTGNYNSSDNKVHYTLTATSTGANTNVMVTDTITGTALSLDSGSIVVKDANGQTVSARPSVSGNGFSLNLGTMTHGQKYTIEYTASVNWGSITGNGTVEQTGNKVKITSNQDPDNPDIETDLNNGISYNPLQKGSGEVIDGEDANTKYIPWTISVNAQYLKNMKGTTITDTIQTPQVLSYANYGGQNGVKLERFRQGSDSPISTEYLSWSDLGVNDADTNKSWHYTIPQDETETLMYRFTYYTKVDLTGQNGNVSVQNNVSDDSWHSAGGWTQTGPGSDYIGVEKSFEGVTRDDMSWKVVMDVPSGGLNKAILTDTLPTMSWSGFKFQDTLIEDSIEIAGLIAPESYQIRVSKDKFVITFYKDQEKTQPGLLASGSDARRSITVTFRTENDQNWLQEYRESDHTNNVAFQGDNSTVYDSASGRPPKVGVSKTGWQIGKVTLSGEEVFAYRYAVDIYGASEKGLPLEITDTFDNTYVRFYDLSTETALSGMDSYWDQYVQNGYKSYKLENGSRIVPTQATNGNQTTLTFRLTEDNVPKNQDDTLLDRYQIIYYLVVKDAATMTKMLKDSIGSDDRLVHITNRVVAMDSEDEVTIDYGYDALTKENVTPHGSAVTGKYDPATGQTGFVITINEGKLDLSSGDTLTLTDSFTSNLSVDYSSIEIYIDDSSTPATLDQVSYDFKGTVGTFTIPDGHKVVIKYNAKVNGNSGEWVSYGNTASMEGYEDSSWGNTQLAGSGDASMNINSIRIYKYAAGNMMKPIPGVEFTLVDEDGYPVLYTTDKSTNEEGSPAHRKGDEVKYVTDASGYATIKPNEDKDGFSLQKGVTYYLRETHTTSAYATNYTTYRFTLSDNPNYSNYEYYSGDIMKIYNWPSEGKLEIKKSFEGASNLTEEDRKKITFTVTGVYKDHTDVSVKLDDWGYPASYEEAVAKGYTEEFSLNLSLADFTAAQGDIFTYAMEDLVPGNYTVTETGWLLNGYTYNATSVRVYAVDENGDNGSEVSSAISGLEATVAVEKEQPRRLEYVNKYSDNGGAKVIIKKINTEDNGTTVLPLYGAKFKLEKLNTTTNEYETYTGGSVDANGYFTIPYSNRKSGVKLTTLTDGTYRISEITAPNSYTIVGDGKFEFTVSGGTVNYGGTNDIAEIGYTAANGTSDATFTVNNLVKHSYNITKVDGANVSVKLAGAVFTVYEHVPGNSKAADLAAVNAGTIQPIRTYVTDKDGKFEVLANDTSEDGTAAYTSVTYDSNGVAEGEAGYDATKAIGSKTYFLLETTAPKGYAVDSNRTGSYFYFGDRPNDVGSTSAANLKDGRRNETVTNDLKELFVQKLWKDLDNNDMKPDDVDQIEFVLYQTEIRTAVEEDGTLGEVISETERPYPDASTTYTIEKDSSGNWNTLSLGYLPVAGARSSEMVVTYTYRVEETVPDGYQVTYSATADGRTMYMTNRPEGVSIEALKVWSDNVPEDLKAKGTELWLQRKKAGSSDAWTDYKSVVLPNLNEDGTVMDLDSMEAWTARWEDLPKDYVYRIREVLQNGRGGMGDDKAARFDIVYSSNNANGISSEEDGGKLIVWNNYRATSIKAKKVWVGVPEGYNYGDTYFKFHLYRRVKGSSDAWSDMSSVISDSQPQITTAPFEYEWTDLDSSYEYAVREEMSNGHLAEFEVIATDEDGNELSYTMSEDKKTMTDMEGVEGGLVTLTNVYTAGNFAIQKSWIDLNGNVMDEAPDITVTGEIWCKVVDADGNAVTQSDFPAKYGVFTLSEAEGWRKEYSELETDAGSGNKYVYYVKEDTVVENAGGFALSYVNNDGVNTGTISLINTKRGDVVQVEKAWLGADGSTEWPDGVSVVVKLIKRRPNGQIIELTGENIPSYYKTHTGETWSATQTLTASQTSYMWENLDELLPGQTYEVVELSAGGSAVADGKVTVGGKTYFVLGGAAIEGKSTLRNVEETDIHFDKTWRVPETITFEKPAGAVVVPEHLYGDNVFVAKDALIVTARLHRYVGTNDATYDYVGDEIAAHTVTLSGSTWSADWDHLPAAFVDAEGNLVPYVYAVEEVSVTVPTGIMADAGGNAIDIKDVFKATSTKSADGKTITMLNTLASDDDYYLSVTKTWKDGNNNVVTDEDAVKFKLLRDTSVTTVGGSSSGSPVTIYVTNDNNAGATNIGISKTAYPGDTVRFRTDTLSFRFDQWNVYTFNVEVYYWDTVSNPNYPHWEKDNAYESSTSMSVTVTDRNMCFLIHGNKAPDSELENANISLTVIPATSTTTTTGQVMMPDPEHAGKYIVDPTGNNTFSLNPSQTINFTNLPYLVKEGNVTTTYKYTVVETTTGAFSTTVTYADGKEYYDPRPSEGDKGVDGSVTITNKKSTVNEYGDATLSLKKVKQGTSDPIEGVTFTLTSGETTVASGQTNANGELSLTIPGSALGKHSGSGDTSTTRTFTLIETVPEGYQAPAENPWTVTVTANGATSTVSGEVTTIHYNWQVTGVGSLSGNEGVYTIENEPTTGSLKLKKIVQENGTDKDGAYGDYFFSLQRVDDNGDAVGEPMYIKLWITGNHINDYRLMTSTAYTSYRAGNDPYPNPTDNTTVNGIYFNHAYQADDFYAILPGLAEGDYWLTELDPNDGSTASIVRGDQSAAAVDAANRRVKVHVTAGVDDPATNTAAVATYTNNKDTVGSLAITKEVTAGSVATDKTFTFEVTLTNANNTPYVGNVKVVDSTRATATTATTDSSGKLTVTVTGTDTATISEIPAGTTYTVTEQALTGWAVDGIVYGDGETTTHTINGGDADTVTVTNKEVVSVSANKTWVNTEDNKTGTVTYELWKKVGDEDSGNVYEGDRNFTVAKGKGKTVDYANNSAETETDADNWPITFINLPKYENGELVTYSVREHTFTYDGVEYEVYWNTDGSWDIGYWENGEWVDKNGLWRMTFDSTTTPGTYAFTNTQLGALKLKKLVLVDGENGSGVNWSRVQGAYDFSVVGPSGAASQITKYVRILVWDGHIAHSSICDNREDLGKDLVYYPDEQTDRWATVERLQSGTYTITELGACEAGSGNTSSTTPLSNVVVLDSITGGNNDANLTAGTITVTVVGGDTDASEASAQAVFTNSTPYVNVPFKAKKTYQGGTLTEGQFTFTLTETDSSWVALENGIAQTKTNAAPETGNNYADVLFDDVKYTETGTHYFIITETVGNDTGIIYDTHVQKVTVNVTADASGKLSYSKTYEPEFTETGYDAAFANKRVSLGLKKIVEAHTNSPVGGNLAYTNGTYTFTVKGPSGDNAQTHTVVITMESGVMTSAALDGTTITDETANATFDATNGVRLTGLTPGTYTVTEGEWSITGCKDAAMYLKNIAVDPATGNTVNKATKTATVNVAVGATVSAAFTNVLEPNVPNLEKQVTNLNDSSDTPEATFASESPWNKSADYDIGDEVPYRITTYLPTNYYRSLDSYTYIIHDTMNHLEYVDGSGRMYAFVKPDSGSDTGAWYDVSSWFSITTGAYANGQQTITVFPTTDNNLKTVTTGQQVTNWGANTHGDKYPYKQPTLADSTDIVNSDIRYLQFRYRAELKEDANIGSTTGNTNTAYLQYSNSATTTANTDSDTNVVYTYKLVVNKQDENGAALAGATFQLFKKYKDDKFAPSDLVGTTGSTFGTGVTSGSSSVTLYGLDSAVTSLDMSGLTNSSIPGNYYRVTGTVDGAAHTWNGIDDGWYILVETQAPYGYKPLAQPVALCVDTTLFASKPGFNSGYINMFPDGGKVNDDVTITRNGDMTGEVACTLTVPNVPYELDIKIKKVDASTNASLTGAVFKLSKIASWTDEDTPKPVWQAVAGVETSNKVPDTNEPIVTVTDGQFTVNGSITLKGLHDGIYKLEEMSSPAGYIITDKTPVTFEIEKGAVKASSNVLTTGVVYTAKADSQDDVKVDTFTIPNTSGAVLPATGGMGTGVIYGAGAALMLLAVLGLILLNRKRTDGEGIR